MMTSSEAFARALVSRIIDTHPGDQFQQYWTRDPEGLAKWAFHPHPWRALYKHLIKHIHNPEYAARTTESWFRLVFGIPSGWRKGSNPVGPG